MASQTVRVYLVCERGRRTETQNIDRFLSVILRSHGKIFELDAFDQCGGGEQESARTCKYDFVQE